MFLSIISKVFSIFIIVGIGVLASKQNLLPENSTAVLSKFLFNIVTPCMVITTMQGRTFEGQLANDAVWSLISYTLVIVIISILSFWVVKPFRISESDKGIYRMQLAFTNIGFMGIPLATAVFGEMSGLLILLMNTPFTVLLYSLGAFLMLYQKGGTVFNTALLKQMVNIPLVASLLGIFLLISGLRIPESLLSGPQMVADTMVPVGMLIVGIQLGKATLSGIFNIRNMIMCVLSLFAIPLLTMLVAAVLPQSDLVSATLVFAMAMPSGTLCTVLAEEYHRNVLLASEALATTTLFSLVSLPIWAAVITHIYLS